METVDKGSNLPSAAEGLCALGELPSPSRERANDGHNPEGHWEDWR